MRSITTRFAEPRPRLRRAALTAYYLAILLGVMALATRGAFSNPMFVYQGF